MKASQGYRDPSATGMMILSEGFSQFRLVNIQTLEVFEAEAFDTKAAAQDFLEQHPTMFHDQG